MKLPLKSPTYDRIGPVSPSVPWEMRRIVWVDAFPPTSVWTAVAELEIPPRVIDSVGFLVARTKHLLVLAASWDTETECVDTTIAIPITAILKSYRI